MTGSEVDGVLLVDKPEGMTSHDVVAVARGALDTRRVGHTGTLDPFATGLLVLLVGHATRLQPYIDGEPKVYEATIRFGVETDTADPTGVAVREAPPPSPTSVAEAVAQLTGPIDQVPPAYSAKQVGGVRAYAAARRSEPLVLRPATVVVHRWNVGARRGSDLDVTITCGGGTYVRALARDLGVLAGSAAHLAVLRRLRSGHFDVTDATTVDRLREGRAVLLPARAAVPGLPAEQLSDLDARRVGHGQPVPATAAGSRAALVTGDGALVAIADRDGDSWRPRLVLRAY
ncbi:MAG: tRNA pseudouridine(55) synthase TruB [Gemmatimonadota bacterium]|nr:tRNA pseudouridine(55) synthase TruB [Gemmatimonadota bacterium]